MYEDPFHMLFLLFCMWMLGLRCYYTGYVDAAGEGVPKLEEGIVLRRLRYGLGFPFILGVALYLLNPSWMEWSQIRDFPRVLRWLGMGILLVSLFLYRWTHAHLDKNFTDTVYVRKEAVLITTGPYRWVRHPMYATGLLVALGTGLALANWFLGVVGIVLMLIIIYLRTPIEENKLLQRHGSTYKEYQKQTGKFFPNLFR